MFGAARASDYVDAVARLFVRVPKNTKDTQIMKRKKDEEAKVRVPGSLA